MFQTWRKEGDAQEESSRRRLHAPLSSRRAKFAEQEKTTTIRKRSSVNQAVEREGALDSWHQIDNRRHRRDQTYVAGILSAGFGRRSLGRIDRRCRKGMCERSRRSRRAKRNSTLCLGLDGEVEISLAPFRYLTRLAQYLLAHPPQTLPAAKHTR